MHRRNFSDKILRNPEEFGVDSTYSKFPFIRSTPRAESCQKSKRRNLEKGLKTSSPVKGIDLLVGRCEIELRKIKKISVKILRSRKVMQKNNLIIHNFIEKPLFSIKVLQKDRPRFLNRYLKYQS